MIIKNRPTTEHFKNMKASLVLKLLILAYLPLSVYYSLQSSFEESTATADVFFFLLPDLQVPAGLSKEICINNSSVFTDMWNERYLHIDSSHRDYSLYSKKTIGVSFLKDKHVSNMIM